MVVGLGIRIKRGKYAALASLLDSSTLEFESRGIMAAKDGEVSLQGRYGHPGTGSYADCASSDISI